MMTQHCQNVKREVSNLLVYEWDLDAVSAPAMSIASCDAGGKSMVSGFGSTCFDAAFACDVVVGDLVQIAEKGAWSGNGFHVACDGLEIRPEMCGAFDTDH